MTKFKVGDIVRIRKDSKYADQDDGNAVVSMNDDRTDPLYLYSLTFSDGSDNTYRDIDLELVKRGRPKAEDLTRYMSYGTGCNNQGSVLLTEKEFKADLKEKAKDNDWTGRLIGYKLTPIFEAGTKTFITKIKTVRKYKKRK